MIPSFKKFSRISLGIVWCFLFPATILPTHGAEFSEDQIKAVYLFNFATFIRWPDSAFSEHPEAFYFCALNEQSPIIKILKKVINGQTSGGRKLVFRQINNQNDLKGCQLLYFQVDEQSKLAELLPELQGRSILTVSDMAHFAERDGMIGIARNNKHLHPMINVQHLEQAGLKASAKLLRLASVVGGNE